MVPQPLITEARLTNLLKIDKTTLRRWRADKLLHAVYINRAVHYTVSAVDYFLTNCEHNLDSPLTVARLLCREIVLVKLAEAADLLNTSHFALLARIHNNQLQAIKIGTSFRVSVSSITEYNRQAKEDARTSLSQDMTCLVFGVTRSKIDEWVNEGELQRVSVAHHKAQQHITTSSVLSLLEKSLPHWITPEHWLSSRLKDRRPLLNRAQLELYLGLPVYGKPVDKLIQNRSLWYLQTPGSRQRKFLPQTVDTIKQRSIASKDGGDLP